ncbi:PucR family transcriptional regulator [Chengkuizengella axinellae]|uniref:Helix-turn-helix domain-containing protein n=1 Tax=Chengkuizengella axinellae TaxID=3064388 RepID=A0ABT9IY84_9BACL|nr:helix-turn-helix domain-containing protein [Chengkuizengella sp. 2205SS18-9]MDP5274278.1 helix-turn-helix domain-containing protein [Chengkuizengella sp. 2205SS18-9]
MELNPLSDAMKIKDLDDITEYISSVIKKPLIIENKNFELISYSSKYAYHFDTSQQKTILSKKCPLFIIDRLKKDGIFRQLEKYPDPIRINPIEELGLYQRIVVSAKHQNQILGYIWVQETDMILNEEELLFLKDISNHVGALLYKRFEDKNSNQNTKEKIMFEMLNQDYNEEEILKFTKTSDISLPTRFTVVVFSAHDREELEEMKPILNKEFLKAKPEVVVLNENNQIIAIIGTEKEQSYYTYDKARMLIRNVRDLLSEDYRKKLLIGMGNEYTYLGQLRKSYVEALEVIQSTEFVDRNDHEVPIENKDLGIYRYISTIHERNIQERYENDMISTLQKYDEKNNTSLIRTLEIYLKNNCKLKKTAEALFIHPNTMNYRLKQIIELTSIDFDNFYIKCQLYIDLLLLKKNKPKINS